MLMMMMWYRLTVSDAPSCLLGHVTVGRSMINDNLPAHQTTLSTLLFDFSCPILNSLLFVFVVFLLTFSVCFPIVTGGGATLKKSIPTLKFPKST